MVSAALQGQVRGHGLGHGVPGEARCPPMLCLGGLAHCLGFSGLSRSPPWLHLAPSEGSRRRERCRQHLWKPLFQILLCPLRRWRRGHGPNGSQRRPRERCFLSQACIDENFDMVKFLVESRADVNQQDNEGWTPLHAAASCGYLNIAE